MTTIRAKFRVEEISRNTAGHNVKMFPVTSGSEENKEFFKWTPSGQLQMGLISDALAAQFEPGQEFYIDFVKAG